MKALDKKNKLDQVPLASIDNNELSQIQQLEQRLGEKYYLIAFEKTNNIK